MKHFCELKFNQAAALGPFVIFCHGRRGIAEPTKQCCNWKAPDFYSHVPPPPACPTDSTREVIKTLYQDRGLVKIHSSPSAKQCVVKGLRFCSTSWRSGWLRTVKAAPRLSGICQRFSEEPAVQQWSGTPDTTLLAFPGALPWGKGDRRRMPRQLCWGPAEQTLDFCLACLSTASTKLVAHPRSRSFWEKHASAALLGTADIKWVCLPLWAMWAGPAWVHIKHDEWRGWELLYASVPSAWFLPLGCPLPCRLQGLHPCFSHR